MKLNRSFLYLGLLLVLSIALLFLYFSSSTDHLYKRSFINNIKAFENGIYFANIRFLTNNPDQNQINQWVDDIDGLDFNANGFPIGTDINDSRIQHPLNQLNCQQIWQFVLGPLQPQLTLSRNDEDYWVDIDEDYNCLYHPNKPSNISARYNSLTGKVLLSN